MRDTYEGLRGPKHRGCVGPADWGWGRGRKWDQPGRRGEGCGAVNGVSRPECVCVALSKARNNHALLPPPW